ncbi:ABC transporter ATP-binding protein [Azospirillum halopraeferens]|uniref:ABC transporter ATP-binding protein n=1 Tax=Azospirillum halopraeferens TaxID=34010 RepID=UPI000412125C|nr:ABC transporter ATP-binding protein [Azospirillum halopraeferens]
MTALLEVEGLSKRFRGLKAVSDVGFAVPQGAIVALIGPNGAGKTTTFNLIAGVFPPDEGSVRLQGRSIAGLKPHRVCAAGIGRTFQIVKPFGNLTVEENVVVGALARESAVEPARRLARAVLARLGLADQASRPARSLTLPDRKRLEVARALATRPTLLLLDEVLAGLRPTEVDRMVEVLRDLNRSEGLTILMIEHVMRAVMALSDHVVVLDHGEKIAEGKPDAIAADPRVIRSYLGTEAL